MSENFNEEERLNSQSLEEQEPLKEQDIVINGPDPKTWHKQYDTRPRNPFPKDTLRFKIMSVLLVIVLLCASFGIYYFAKTLFTYTLTIDPNGGIYVGEPYEPIKYKFREIIREPENVNIKKTGYYLAGWYADKDGKNDYVFGKEIWRSTTIYAKWEKGPGIVLNFAEGEENDYLSEENLKYWYEWYYKPGTEVSVPVIFNEDEKHNHYGERIFWYDNPECDGEPILSKTFTIEEDLELWGKWFDVNEDNYVVDNGTFTKYVGYCNNLYFPEGIKAIKSVTPEDFKDNDPDNLNDNYNELLTKSAFAKVIDRLERVYLNEDLEIIGSCAFRSCAKLEVLEFRGDNVTEIGEEAFRGCEALKEFKIPSKVTVIKARTFRETRSLQRIEITDNIETIETQAFINSGITKLLVSENLEYIGIGAFQGLGNGKRVEIYFYGDKVINSEEVNVKDDEMFLGVTLTDLYIYVLDELVVDYKSTAPWSQYADKISKLLD